jgi:cytochrome c peroxidase
MYSGSRVYGNVAVTGPYFHDGREAKLEGAVKTMAKAQLGRKLRGNEINKLLDVSNCNECGNPVSSSREMHCVLLPPYR